MKQAHTQNILKDWERTQELPVDLPEDELLVLLPGLQKALSASIEELLASRRGNSAARQLYVAFGKLAYPVSRGDGGMISWGEGVPISRLEQ